MKIISCFYRKEIVSLISNLFHAYTITYICPFSIFQNQLLCLILMCKCDSVHDAHYTYGEIPNFERNINVISTEYVSIKMQITLTCKTISRLSLLWIFSWINFEIEFHSLKHSELKSKFQEKSIFTLLHCMCSFHFNLLPVAFPKQFWSLNWIYNLLHQKITNFLQTFFTLCKNKHLITMINVSLLITK